MDKMTLDCRGMQCPAPILQLAKVARQASKGPLLLEMLADDSDFPTDLKAWCRTTRAALHSLTSEEGVHRAVVGLNGARLEEAPEGSAAAPEPTGGGPAGDASKGGSRSDPPSVTRQQAVPGREGNGASAPATVASRVPAASVLDLRGLRAPHPVLRLSRILLEGSRSRLTVHCDDPSFTNDLVAWTTATRIMITGMRREGELVLAELALPGWSEVGAPANAPAPAPEPAFAPAPASLPVPAPAATALQETRPLPAPAPTTALAMVDQAGIQVTQRQDRCTILVLHNDFEALMAALLVATTSAAQGMEVVVFFSFWGVNLLRGDRPRAGEPPARVSFLQRLMKWMMPKGPRRQKMSKMHMAGMGKGMMEYFMRRNNVMSIAQLMDVAIEQRVRFVVCTMSMGIMGIQKSDVMDLPNIEFAGVTTFVEQSRTASMSLVF